ncbi:hypothetical protein [Noviherbaspirillum pedocola]|uniref:Lipoprotein n=1 Tax=Noviherbaspirillum pedocola TaxID=2801341 RepID=A0A934W5A4_9BURK|nr:hypothetical protein [Noviherbaspirillum pedocola]MBK4733660.1 hypothetical protein [Noviherbaspirillum pedocola]
MRMTLAWLLVGLLAGCAPTMPRTDARFGHEVRALLAAQALPGTEPPTQAEDGTNKDAARILPALDGTAARAALTAYQRHAVTARPGGGNGGISAGGGVGIAGGSAR